NLDTFYIHIVIFAIALFVFYRLYIKALRLRSSYELYQVRDELIYLVASGIINEDDKVFQFYYEKINGMLAMAPDVGLHNALEILFNHKDIRKALKENERKTREVLREESMSIPEVREVITKYYCSVRMMILSHSSIFKISYLLSNELSNRVVRNIAKTVLSSSKTFSDAQKVVKYAEGEAELIKDQRFKNMRRCANNPI
ncbi:MAG: hypothetical protein SVR94_10505, partial [Pseudomonadota bacterium]|nr:hypothetical protein [Pseudomonadota bacterium]